MFKTGCVVLGLWVLPLVTSAQGFATMNINDTHEIHNILSMKHGVSRWHRIMNSNRPTAASDSGGEANGAFRVTKVVDVLSHQFYHALEHQHKFNAITVSLRSKPNHSYHQYRLEGVTVKSVKPINPSKVRRAAYEIITFRYDKIRWVSSLPKKNGRVATAF